VVIRDVNSRLAIDATPSSARHCRAIVGARGCRDANSARRRPRLPRRQLRSPLRDAKPRLELTCAHLTSSRAAQKPSWR